jgi:hypothetical protein
LSDYALRANPTYLALKRKKLIERIPTPRRASRFSSPEIRRFRFSLQPSAFSLCFSEIAPISTFHQSSF